MFCCAAAATAAEVQAALRAELPRTASAAASPAQPATHPNSTFFRCTLGNNSSTSTLELRSAEAAAAAALVCSTPLQAAELSGAATACCS